MATILVVDDELGIRALLSEILTDEGHTIELAENAAQARAVRERLRPDLVLLDIWMPDVDGISLLKEWGSSAQLTMPVIMMSGHGTIDTAVEATKFGAMAFLEKPITMQKLLKAVEQALSKPSPRAMAAAAPINMAPSMASSGHHGGVSLASSGMGSLGGGMGGSMGGSLGSGIGGPMGGGLGAGLGSARLDGYASHTNSGYLHGNDLGHGGGHLGGGHMANNHLGSMHHGGGHMGGTHLSSMNSPMASLGPQSEQSFELDRPLREARDAFEKSYFEFHLAREGGSMTRVAEKTGLERTHLYRKLKQLGVDLSRNKRGSSSL